MIQGGFVVEEFIDLFSGCAYGDYGGGTYVV